jgi:hypothetical protein
MRQRGVVSDNEWNGWLRWMKSAFKQGTIAELLYEEYEKCLVGLNAITREAWNTFQTTEDKREKIQALSLAKECYSMKLDLLTNATVLDDAIRFVTQKGASNAEPKSGADPIVMEKQKQEQLENNIGEQELDNSSIQ